MESSQESDVPMPPFLTAYDVAACASSSRSTYALVVQDSVWFS